MAESDPPTFPGRDGSYSRKDRDAVVFLTRRKPWRDSLCGSNQVDDPEWQSQSSSTGAPVEQPANRPVKAHRKNISALLGGKSSRTDLQEQDHARRQNGDELNALGARRAMLARKEPRHCVRFNTQVKWIRVKSRVRMYCCSVLESFSRTVF